MDYLAHYDSPLGGITIAADGEALTGLWFDGQRYFGDTLRGASAWRAVPVTDGARRWLDIYFGGKEPDFTPAVRMRASPFRRLVWEILLTVPFGRTVTYGDIARRAASMMNVPRMSARAVGGAVSRNPVSLIVPCHRVIGSDGSLTGYASGTDRKIRLLRLERADFPVCLCAADEHFLSTETQLSRP